MHMSKLKQQLEAAGVRVNVRPFGFELLGHGHRVLVADLQAIDRHDIAALTGTQRPALGKHGFRLGRDVRCPSNFVFQRVALMPPGIAEQHAC